MTLQFKRQYICPIEDFSMGYHHIEHIYQVSLKELSVLAPMKLKTHGYEILIYIFENLIHKDYRWVMVKLSRLSTP